MKRIYVENWVKNVLILVILFPVYFEAQKFLQNFPNSTDTGVVGSMLVAVSILAVTACFGNFAFTYEKADNKSLMSRLMAHITTGLLMLLIGLSLEMTSILTTLLIGTFPIFNMSLIILYVASVLYDFWDLKRSRL